MFPIPKNIIFDLDGVLIFSEHLHAVAKQKTLAPLGINLTLEFIDSYTGRTDQVFWEEIKLSHPEIKEDILTLNNLKKEVYQTLTSELKPVTGSVEFVTEAKNKGIVTGVVTSSDTFYQSIAFDFLGVNSLIDHLVNADAVTKHKPDPMPYLKMKELMQAKTTETFVIEDSPSGIKAAKTAGFFVVGLTTSFDSDKLKSVGADFTIDSYQDLKKKLEW